MAEKTTDAHKLWGGRFTGATDPLMDRFNASLPFDKRLYRQDVVASQAYARELAHSGIITGDECAKICTGLDQVLNEWANGTFAEKPGDEDIHTANERRLGEVIGKEIAGKLHTGRSRNDQVATDFRLWVKDEIRLFIQKAKDVIDVLVKRAESEVDVLIPGYTHLQRAQPVRWSHFLLAHANSFRSDVERLQDLQHSRRINSLPLGSGALAGNPFRINRERLAKELGFKYVASNSIHAVSDRDFCAEYLFAASMVQLHISRLAEDLILYASAEFGFVSLADAYSTGSSLMPQKKNPDSLELLRGKTGRVIGGLTGLLITLKGLPAAYNKDLQEDKEPVFDAADTVGTSLDILAGVLATMTIKPDRMRGALSSDMLATDLADHLVRRGVPFRDTHHVAGAAVKLAEDTNRKLHELTLTELRGLHSKFGDDVCDTVWDIEASVERRDAYGGTAKARVLEQCSELKAWLQEK